MKGNISQNSCSPGWLHVADTHSASFQSVMLLKGLFLAFPTWEKERKEQRQLKKEETEKAAGLLVKLSPSPHPSTMWPHPREQMPDGCAEFPVGLKHHLGLCCGEAQLALGQSGTRGRVGPKGPCL